MLTVTYSDEARRSADFPLVERASELLAGIIDRAEEPVGAEPVTAEWSMAGRERGRDVFRLRLSDYAGEAEKTIRADRLDPLEEAETRVLGAWAWLLDGRMKRTLAGLREAEE